MGYDEELSTKIYVQLLEELRTGRFKNEKRLPPEVELGEMFGASRNVVRDSLGILERAGIVTRKRGVGTIINRYVLDMEPRMDFALGFDSLIETSGYKAENIFTRRSIEKADELIAEKLQIKAGDPVYRIERLDSADGVPAIYDIDYLRVNYTDTEKAAWKTELIDQSVYDFIKNTVHMNVAQLKPVIIDEKLARACLAKSGEAALFVSSVHYTLKGVPVLFSNEYYLSDKIQHRILRKRI